jgi:hypothetical protein
MSMNLECRVNRKPISLWQTPTWITYMCLATKDGIQSELTGASARRAMYCYIEYIKGRLNGVWTSNEDYEAVAVDVREEVARIRALLADSKNKFTVYSV